jgi:hypothetical protein
MSVGEDVPLLTKVCIEEYAEIWPGYEERSEDTP